MPDLVPKEAVDFIRNKSLKAGFSYEDVWKEEHTKAFTVAKCMELDLLKDIHDSITEAIESGIPYREWAKDIEKVMVDKGWWGVQKMEDPLTGEMKEVQLGSPRRLETIFGVNMRQAYNVGVFRQAMDSDAHPYLMYRIGNSKKHREEHVSWDGLVLPKDDPWWDTHMPPNGWGCKCYVRAVSKARYERLKKEGLPDETRREYGKDLIYKKIKTRPPMDIPMEYVNKRRNEVYRGVRGIDPGFEYNPASGSRDKSLRESFAEKSKDLTAAVNGGTKPTSDSLRTPIADAFSSIPKRWSGTARTVCDAISSVHGDGTLHKIPIRTTSSAKYYGQFTSYPDLPVKISMSTHAEGAHAELTLAHEIGHFLDNDAFPKERGKHYASEGSPSPKVSALMNALKGSDAIRNIRKEFSGRSLAYYTKPTEMIARSYAQYIAVKSGNARMMQQLDDVLNTESGYRYTQWTEADFRPIMKAYDELFEEIGWLEKNER